jgi:hypothetical protein
MARIQSACYSKEKNFTATYFNHSIYLDKDFFELSILSRTLVIIHEARHADGDDFSHINCKEGFRFLSIRKPEVDLTNIAACDNSENGAYGLSADFIFELMAYGLGDKEQLTALYNSEIARIIKE